MKKRFIIYGAGAIGSTIGGLLAASGHNVTLVGRRAHMEVVRENGLSITGLLGDHLVRDITAVETVSELQNDASPEYILVSVKSFDTRQAAAEIKDAGLAGPGTFVVSCQNGLGNVEALEETFGPARAIGARVIFGAEVTEPGSVFVSVWADSVLLGGQDRTVCEALAEEMTEAGVETRFEEKIGAALWGKVLYNVGLNSLSALLDVPYGELGRIPEAREVLVGMIREAFEVASGEGSVLWGSCDEYLELFFGKLLPATEGHISSMLQDLRKGRPIEIEAINGEVIRRGRVLGVQTPINNVVYNLVNAKAAARSSTGDRSN